MAPLIKSNKAHLAGGEQAMQTTRNISKEEPLEKQRKGKDQIET